MNGAPVPGAPNASARYVLSKFNNVATVVLDHRESLTDDRQFERLGENLNLARLQTGDREINVFDVDAKVVVTAASQEFSHVVGERQGERIGVSDYFNLEGSKPEIGKAHAGCDLGAPN
jgi:hypothetical protein